MLLRTVPALALAALLALGGLAAAGDDRGESGAPDGSKPCDRQPVGPDRERCLKDRLCRDHPADPRCAGRPGDGTANGSEPRQRTVDRLGHIQFTLESPSQIASFRVDGQLVLDRLTLDTGASGKVVTERRGGMVIAGDADTRLRLHDNPAGLIEFKGEDGGAQLAFPAGVQVTAGERGHAVRIHYPDGRDGLLVADSAAWQGRNVTLAGFFTFHVARSDGPFKEEAAGGELRPKLKAAVESRRLGAEVALERNPANASRAVQVLAYDNLEVNVSLPGGGAPIAVRLSANLTQGRTVVLHVDPALLDNATADRLQLRYFDDHDDGTQTEVVFAEAGGLADALDPTDDGGRPEYWVVSDADGLQILVSVPHWSTHTVTLAGLGALVQPSVLLGIVVGSAGIAVAAVAMFWPRRRD